MDREDDLPETIIRYCSTCGDYRSMNFLRVRDGQGGRVFAEYQCSSCFMPRSAYVTNLREEIRQQGDLVASLLSI